MKKDFGRFDVITWLFLAGNMIYGLGFWLIDFLTDKPKSSLYDSLNDVSHTAPIAWGLMLSISVVASVVAYTYNLKRVGLFASFLGMFSWGFATWVYLLTGYYLVALSVGLLYLSFWVWFYFIHFSKLNNWK